VEIITVIIIVTAYAFPPNVSILATLVFCTCQWLIYGFGYWVVAYYIYWPFLAVVSLSLKLVRNPLYRNIAAVVIAVTLTAFFGVLTSAIDAAFASRLTRDFLIFFPIIYLRGIYFYLTHLVSNLVIVSLLFTPLAKVFALRRVP
jgi:hypothetical protein